jgi:hypothetical protein
MRHFVETAFSLAAVVGAEAWFLQGYFAGKPEFEPALVFVAALGVALLREPIRATLATKRLAPNAHDCALFAEFLSILPTEPTIRTLREQDFGDSFRKKSIDPLFDFVHVWQSVEKEFVDSSLEKERKTVYASAWKLAQEIAGRTVPVRIQGHLSVFPDQQRASGEPRPPNVLEDARVLNQLASEFVPIYERFVRLCRDRLVR